MSLAYKEIIACFQCLKAPENLFIFLSPPPTPTLFIPWKKKKDKIWGLYKITELLEITYVFFPDYSVRFTERKPNQNKILLAFW